MQTLYLATNFNPIYWNTACLIVNSGLLEDNSEEEIVDIYTPEQDDLANGVTFEDLPDRKGKIRKTASTDYSKIAKAIGDIRKAGINVSLVNINESGLTFKPDAANNQILFGFKGMLNVGDDLIRNIIKNRPYVSMYDFYNRVSPNKQAMIALIKGGAFDCFADRKRVMAEFIWLTCDKKKRLTLQNLPGLIRYKLLPEETEEQILARRIYEFNRYLKAVCKVGGQDFYKLDDRARNFLFELSDSIDGLSIFTEETIETLNIKTWDKFYQSWMDVFRNWIASDKDGILDKLNTAIFKIDWDKYAKGSISAWEMEALCFYYHDHELKNVNADKYGIVDFTSLPETPIVEKLYKRGGSSIPIYKLFKICGTCIAKNKTKSTVYVLTNNGVVPVKFSREYFSMFDKQISEKQQDGTKKVLEKSWFNRGNMIMVQGIRRSDEFVAKKYASSQGHQLYHIDSIDEFGNLTLRHERAQGEIEDVI